MHDFAKIRHVVFDMDGTIYLGGQVFPETRLLLRTLDELAIGYSFLTNNCSHSRGEYVRRLREIGIHVEAGSIWTSAQATAHYLSTMLPGIQKLFVLGTPGLVEDFKVAGFQVVDDKPDAVVVGFDTNLTYDRLAQTAYWISQQMPYIATHPDRVCPTDRAIVLPDCGAVCALLECATGRKPDAVPGKPSRQMLQSILADKGVEAHEAALVGDRLYTDIRMARATGATAILTLTGETQLRDLEACPEDDGPDLVVKDLGELRQLFIASTR